MKVTIRSFRYAHAMSEVKGRHVAESAICCWQVGVLARLAGSVTKLESIILVVQLIFPFKRYQL